MNITFYEGVEEMLDALDEAMQAADANTQDWQKAIKVGDCFRQEIEYGFSIYGTVIKCYSEERLKNYRFCECFSEACPDGELGDVHTSIITEVITRDEFDEIVGALKGD